MNVQPEDDIEATDAHEGFSLPFTGLEQYSATFFAIRFFFAFCARGVSLSSHLVSTIFCLKTFSQQVSLYTSLLSPSFLTMQHKSSVYSYHTVLCKSNASKISRISFFVCVKVRVTIRVLLSEISLEQRTLFRQTFRMKRNFTMTSVVSLSQCPKFRVKTGTAILRTI